MNEPEEFLQRKRYKRIGLILTLLLIIILTAGIILGVLMYPSPVGPKQPIPFSHKVHAGKKEIGCMVCHPEAAITSTGGIPPLNRCMHCHSRIITSFMPIKDLHSHYNENKPVKWNRVIELPDFVYFQHSIHVNRSIDCSRCHGDVKKMDRIVKVHKINMGFCMSCHRNYNAPVDCFACHR